MTHVLTVDSSSSSSFLQQEGESDEEPDSCSPNGDSTNILEIARDKGRLATQ